MNDVERAFQDWYAATNDGSWWHDECETFHTDEEDCPEWQTTIELIANESLVSDDAVDIKTWIALHKPQSHTNG